MKIRTLKFSSKLEEYQKLYGSFSENRLKDLRYAVEKGGASRSEIDEFATLISFERIRTFMNFVKSMNYPIDYQWFHWLLMEVIDDMIESKTSRRLMIELPPRHCKTLIAGLLLCTYLFGRFKDKSIIYATANNDKARNEASHMRDIITSERYQQLFPGAKVKSSIDDISSLDKRTRKNKKDTATVLSNVFSERGSIRSAGMGDMLSGHPAHFGIADDLYKGYAEAQSDKMRENIWQWFTTVFLSRMDKATVGNCAHVIAFFTRWHDDDIFGRIQKLQNENESSPDDKSKKNVIEWELFSFEAIKTENKPSHPEDPRVLGDPLWKLYEPEYYSTKLMNPMMFEAMYQANPVNMMGRLFEKHHFQEYDTLPENVGRIVIAIDPNLKEGKQDAKTRTQASSDNFAITVLGISGNRVYLLDFVAKSKDYKILKIETLAILRKYPYYWAVVIEQTASGPALTSDLKQMVGRIVEFSPGSTSKFEKASLILPTLQDGNYFVPSPKIRPDIGVFVNQHLGFNGEKGRHDDLVDANVIGLLYYMQNKCISNISFMETLHSSPVPNLIPSNNRLTIKNLLPRYRNNGSKNARF